MSDRKIVQLNDNLPTEVEIKKFDSNLEEKIFSSLKLNINAYKEVNSITNDDSKIKKSISLIPRYLKDFELCTKCSNNSIKDCLHYGSIGYRLTPVINFNELDFKYSPCYKLNRVKEKMKKFNLYYDSEVQFYLDGIQLISFYNDLNDNHRLKSSSEIGLLFDYVTKIVDNNDFNKPGFIISSKKNGLSSRILKSIGLLFMNLDVSITYIDSQSIFESLFYDDSDEYTKIFNTMCKSQILLLDNIDKVGVINESLNEEYIGKLLSNRNNENLITFVTTSKPMNQKYLTTRFFKNSIYKSKYENLFNKLFNVITVTDTI